MIEVRALDGRWVQKWQAAEFVPRATATEATYLALFLGLEQLVELAKGDRSLVLTASANVFRQLEGTSECGKASLVALRRRVRPLQIGRAHV